MQSNVVTGAQLGKQLAALKISSASRKHYQVPPIEFISDTEPSEKGMYYCAYKHFYSFSSLATHMPKQVNIYCTETDETDAENIV